VVGEVVEGGHADGVEVARDRCRVCPPFHLAVAGEAERGEETDDGHDRHELDQREAASAESGSR
jgi:hypothetical protein